MAGCQGTGGDADTGEARIPQDLALIFCWCQAHLEALPPPLRPHSSISAGGALGSSAHEPGIEVSLLLGAMPEEAPASHTVGHQEAACGPQVVGNPSQHLKGQFAKSIARWSLLMQPW